MTNKIQNEISYLQNEIQKIQKNKNNLFHSISFYPSILAYIFLKNHSIDIINLFDIFMKIIFKKKMYYFFIKNKI